VLHIGLQYGRERVAFHVRAEEKYGGRIEGAVPIDPLRALPPQFGGSLTGLTVIVTVAEPESAVPSLAL